MPYVVIVEAAVVKDAHYLIITRSEQETQSPGEWSLPGGKVEESGRIEDILEKTVCREVLEETGIEVKTEMVYVESTLFRLKRGELAVSLVFLCRHRSGEAQAGSPDEVSAVHWLTAAEMNQHPQVQPWTRRSIELAEQKRRTLGW